MPWEKALEIGSPLGLCVLLVWLIWQLIQVVLRQQERMERFSEVLQKAISALEMSAAAQSQVCHRLERMEDATRAGTETVRGFGTILDGMVKYVSAQVRGRDDG